jgi:hypothetical protein
VEQLALAHVDGQHLPRAQRPLLDNGRLVHGHHAGLGLPAITSPSPVTT